jgi:prepilin-type N-terminal cleavage/methylation domain-containing protein
MPRRTERALTLLEVMAAVAILGIVYAYLARAASQGILTTGETRWRLEASLLADRVLVDLEREMQATGTLEAGETEFDEGDFHVVRRVEPFELPPELVPQADTDDDAGASLLTADGNRPGILRRIRIEVSWFDGIHERTLERISFGYDEAGAAALLGGLAPGADAAPDAEP